MWLSFSGRCCSGTALGALLCICWFWSWIKKSRANKCSGQRRSVASRLLQNSPHQCWLTLSCLHIAVEFPLKIQTKPLFASFAVFSTTFHCWIYFFLMSQRAPVWHQWLGRVSDQTYSWGLTSSSTQLLCFWLLLNMWKFQAFQLYVSSSVLKEAAKLA